MLYDDDLLENEKESSGDFNLKPEIRVGITQGDINGIGYEVILKALQMPETLDLFTPIIYGSSKIASYHRKTLSIPDLAFHHVRKANQSIQKKVNIVNIIDQEIKVELGKATEIAGELAAMALEHATADLIEGNIDVLVTAPINKKNIQSSTFTTPGHTEYLANRFNVSDSLMLMVCDKIRVGLVSGHIPINQVSDKLSGEKILSKIRIMNESLKIDFGIRAPKIAVLGLNPHAGDNGLLGHEEQEIITPAIKTAMDEGMFVFGPFPADGFFGSATFLKFDGILAMYHDQGLTPFKLLAQGEGVNFTAGLPFVRTSPAHGTAYEIAGKDSASESSMLKALFLATDIYKKRKEYHELNMNPLGTQISDTRDNQSDD